MTQTTANFELGTNGVGVTAGDPGSATAWDSMDLVGGNTITYDNTHFYGTLAAKVDNTASNNSTAAMQWAAALGTLTDWYGRIYLYATSVPSSQFRLLTDSNGNIPLFINSSGQIAMLDQGGFAVTTTTPIATNQWVRIEWHWLNSATVGQVEVKLFNNPDSATATETQTSAANRNTSVSTTFLSFGLNDGAATPGPIWLDNIVAGATSYPGPVTVPVTTPQVLSMQSHVFGHGVW